MSRKEGLGVVNANSGAGDAGGIQIRTQYLPRVHNRFVEISRLSSVNLLSRERRLLELALLVVN